MVFKKYCMNATLFDVANLTYQPYDTFIMAMLLCHSVEVTKKDSSKQVNNAAIDPSASENQLSYVASSPEEKASLEVLKESGYEFLGFQLNGTISVCIKGKRMTYTRLAELPFDSYRKCMTVIVKETHVDSSNVSNKEQKHETIHVFTKGADVVIIPACVTPTTEAKTILEKTQIIVNTYASDGLRTLVYGYKQLTRHEFEIFTSQLEQAKESMVNRTKFIRDAYKQIESNGLHLLGATAIEDKLQEQVAETIDKLARAGITTWMVTGDKKETAVNLGYASGKIRLIFIH